MHHPTWLRAPDDNFDQHDYLMQCVSDSWKGRWRSLLFVGVGANTMLTALHPRAWRSEKARPRRNSQ